MNKKTYILYSYNRFNDDLEYIKEYNRKADILKDVKLKNKYSLNHYITNSVENIKQLLNNKYIIIEDIKDV